MNARSFYIAVLAGLLVAVLALGLACGGGDGDGGDGQAVQQDFFEQLNELSQQYELLGEGLAGQLEESLAADASEQERLVAIRDLLADVLAAFEEFIDGVDGLNAPADFQPGQERVVQGGRDAAEAWRDTLDQIDDAGSEEEAKQLIEDLFTGPAFEGADKPCFAQHALGIDIGCPANPAP
jgi:hypothetical protein